ncbi:MAG: helix-turn-helix domain-containing protein [Gloeotrichia echinulata HAB0833]
MNINKMLVPKQPEFGNFLREIRITTNLTQAQFAASLGVSYPSINRWENGHVEPSPLAMGYENYQNRKPG